jgi:hypothetical protein
MSVLGGSKRYTLREKINRPKSEKVLRDHASLQTGGWISVDLATTECILTVGSIFRIEIMSVAITEKAKVLAETI